MHRPDEAGDEARPRDRGAAATKKRILDAAEREFAARGFAGARLKAIADGAGVQPALIHHYFDDKQGLYRMVLDRALGEASIDSWTLLERRRDLEGLVEGFVELLVGFYAAHQPLMSILRLEMATGSTVFAEVARERTLPIVDAVVAVLAEKQREGVVRRDVRPEDVVLAGLSMIVYPFVDAAMLAELKPDAWGADGAALARRKQAIAAMLIGALRP